MATYGFDHFFSVPRELELYVTAWDNVGNSRSTPPTPDTQTTVLTANPLVLSPFVSPPGEFGFTFTSQVGRPYAIDVSTNLTSWQTVTNFTSSTATTTLS